VFYQRMLSGQPSRLPAFLQHAVQYRDDLGNCGDFLNLFGALLKKGLGIAFEKPAIDNWMLLKVIDPVRQMLVLGKVSALGEEVPTVSRIFEIYQNHDDPSGDGVIVLRWSERVVNCVKSSEKNGEQADQDCAVANVSVAPVIKVCSLKDHLEEEGKNGFRQPLSIHLDALGIQLAAKDAPKPAAVLFLHWNTNVETEIQKFLKSDGAIGVILLSTTKNPHLHSRDSWNQKHGGKVQALIYEDEDFDSTVTRTKLREVLSFLEENANRAHE
jgi:hypothetical protein